MCVFSQNFSFENFLLTNFIGVDANHGLHYGLCGTKYSRMDQGTKQSFFKGCLPQILLGLFLNTLSRMPILDDGLCFKTTQCLRILHVIEIRVNYQLSSLQINIVIRVSYFFEVVQKFIYWWLFNPFRPVHFRKLY